jgi:1,4-dihydroxy-2-naphthoate octaprenyltransferase
MCAYFLGLASIVVVVIGGHFPWFILAPLAILLMAAHVRRVEAKFGQKPPRHVES